MSWKDEWRDHKEDTGLSWSEYHDRWFVHRTELDDLHNQLERIDNHLQAATNTYRQMHREAFEQRLMEGHCDE